MAKIEEGDNGDPQKIDAWIARSNLGKLNRIWICQISGLSQIQWTPISKAGYFNSLEWKYPNNISSIFLDTRYNVAPEQRAPKISNTLKSNEILAY